MNKMGSDLTRKLSRSKAWELHTVALNAELPEELTRIALMLKSGYPYTEIRVIPSEDAMRDTDWDIKEPSHLIYGKLGQKRLRERKAKPYFRHVSVECCPRDENGDVREGYSQLISLGRMKF